MGPESGLQKRSIEVAVAQIDSAIRLKKREIDELEKARADFLKLGGSTSSAGVPQSTTRRLRRGVPRQLTEAAFVKYHILSIPELRFKVKQDKDIELRDSTTRRAIDALEGDGIIRLRDDGKYEYVGHPPEEEDHGLQF